MSPSCGGGVWCGNLPIQVGAVNQLDSVKAARARSSRSPEHDRRACEDGPSVGPGIIVPLAVLAVAIPVVLGVTRRRFKLVAAGIGPDLRQGSDPSVRLTSNALRALSTPPWRVVHEIGVQRLGGIDHVVIGPPGVLPITTT